LLTLRAGDLGQMSCNPSIGGVGKGHLVREVDAMGGLMAKAADRAAIHRRLLNASKGSAVRGPRVQATRSLYRQAVAQMVMGSGVSVIEGEAVALLLVGQAVGGVVLADETPLECRAVVLATGRFLGATIVRGGGAWVV